MFFSNTNRTNQTNLASVRHLLSLGQYMYVRQQHITRQSEPQQPQAVTLANPFRIPLHKKNKGQKKNESVVKDSVCILLIRESFFDLSPVAEGSQDELWQDLPQFIFHFIIYRTLTGRGDKKPDCPLPCTRFALPLHKISCISA